MWNTQAELSTEYSASCDEVVRVRAQCHSVPYPAWWSPVLQASRTASMLAGGVHVLIAFATTASAAALIFSMPGLSCVASRPAGRLSKQGGGSVECRMCVSEMLPHDAHDHRYLASALQAAPSHCASSPKSTSVGGSFTSLAAFTSMPLNFLNNLVASGLGASLLRGEAVRECLDRTRLPLHYTVTSTPIAAPTQCGTHSLDVLTHLRSHGALSLPKASRLHASLVVVSMAVAMTRVALLGVLSRPISHVP